eukprot:7384510-Prymnesium_polylepis.1
MTAVFCLSWIRCILVCVARYAAARIARKTTRRNHGRQGIQIRCCSSRGPAWSRWRRSRRGLASIGRGVEETMRAAWESTRRCLRAWAW